MESVSLVGSTVVVTGANTGIGRETARELAKRGARVILACRNEEKGEEARRDIIKDTKNENVVVKILDLASLKSIKSFSDDYNQNESRLDILVNNAGVFARERRETEDGFEMDFGTNHLGHFYLTYLLLEKLKESAPSRIVSISSVGHSFGKLDFKDLQTHHGWRIFKAYGRSKTANILMTTYLAKHLQGTGVTTYSLHPGAVDTEIARDYEGSCLGSLFKCLCCCCGPCVNVLTPEEGAQTTLYCCLEPSIAQHTGRYYSDCKEARAKSFATDFEKAERLWKVSADLCGVPPNFVQSDRF